MNIIDETTLEIPPSLSFLIICEFSCKNELESFWESAKTSKEPNVWDEK